MNKFGDLIRNTREDKEMLLRHIAAELDVNTRSCKVKIGRGKNRKNVNTFWLLLNYSIDPEELIALWLA